MPLRRTGSAPSLNSRYLQLNDPKLVTPPPAYVDVFPNGPPPLALGVNRPPRYLFLDRVRRRPTSPQSPPETPFEVEHSEINHFQPAYSPVDDPISIDQQTQRRGQALTNMPARSADRVSSDRRIAQLRVGMTRPIVTTAADTIGFGSHQYVRSVSNQAFSDAKQLTARQSQREQQERELQTLQARIAALQERLESFSDSVQQNNPEQDDEEEGTDL